MRLASIATCSLASACAFAQPSADTPPILVADVRLQFRVDKQWTLSAGVDNLNNKRYWAFHPYPQRTFHAEIGFDL